MKNIDLGQVFNTLANLGVIAGILLLVVELNQNRDMMRAQTRNELARGLNEVLSFTINDAELADLSVRSNNGDQLTAAEAMRLRSRDELSFRYWENVHYQYRQDLYDESEFSRHRDTMNSVLSRNPRLVRYWCSERMLYSIPFMEFIDGLLSSQPCLDK